MRFRTTIVVNPNPKHANNVQDMIDESADVVGAYYGRNRYRRIPGFHTDIILGLKNAIQLSTLFHKFYDNFAVIKKTSRTNSTTFSTRKLLESQSEYVRMDN